MKCEVAIAKAKLIAKEFPQFYLTGSVALILQGLLPERDVKDIDFVCLKSDTPIEFEQSGVSDGGIQILGAPCCVFGERNAVKGGPVIDGVKCCDPEKTIEAKNKYNRTKDKRDFDAMLTIDPAPITHCIPGQTSGSHTLSTPPEPSS